MFHLSTANSKHFFQSSRDYVTLCAVRVAIYYLLECEEWKNGPAVLQACQLIILVAVLFL